jgi:hypothetical protein
MGWWKVGDTEIVIGDLPLDALGEAVTSVVAEYQATYGRRPTREEWEALLHAVMGVEDDEFKLLDKGTIQRVRLEVHL